MPLQFASLGSGSKGNATLVRSDDVVVMVDCGFSVRQTEKRLEALGVEAAQISALLVTHEHSDHASGVAGLARRFDIPVYLTHGTAASGRCGDLAELNCFNCGDTLTIGPLSIQAIAVPHDAAEPCQFRFDTGDSSLGILTDLGSITPHVVDSFRDCCSLLLEFNHDYDMLHNGEYPPQLKRRVGGDWGHLSNSQAATLLRELGADSLNHLVVAHMSDKNNRRDLAEEALRSVMESLDSVVFAEQGHGFSWLDA